MDKMTRVNMVRAMDFIMRQINDERLFDSWLMVGVADGDVHPDYKGKDREEEDEYLYNMYCTEDEYFVELVQSFMNLMQKARTSGGLFVDNVLVLPEYIKGEE